MPADLSKRDRAWLDKHRNGTEVFVKLASGPAYERDCRAIRRLIDREVVRPNARDTGTHFAFEVTDAWYRRLEGF